MQNVENSKEQKVENSKEQEYYIIYDSFIILFRMQQILTIV